MTDNRFDENVCNPRSPFKRIWQQAWRTRLFNQQSSRVGISVK